MLLLKKIFILIRLHRYRWTHTPGKIADNDTADVTCEWWHRYDLDVAFAAKLGATAFRVSIAWERSTYR
jgi:beta-glucosidase/6-phospho-beta-glucosidase/beta-galactosidase